MFPHLVSQAEREGAQSKKASFSGTFDLISFQAEFIVEKGWFGLVWIDI